MTNQHGNRGALPSCPNILAKRDLWFSRGMVFQANLQNPLRAYLRRGETRAAIRNLYNSFVAWNYRALNIFTEEYRQWRMPSGPFYNIPRRSQIRTPVTRYDPDRV
jgi:hypothetical protein